MQRSSFRLLAIPTLLLVVAALSWSLYYDLTVVGPDRSRVITESARILDVSRSLSRQTGYLDRWITPVQAEMFQTGPPHPVASWSPIYTAMVGMWFSLSGRQEPFDAVVIGALGYALALFVLYALARLVLGPRLAWIPPLFLAFSPRVLALATDALAGGWFTAFLLVGLLFLIAPGRIGLHVAAAGLALALAQLARPSTILFMPVMAALAMRAPLAPAIAERDDADDEAEPALEPDRVDAGDVDVDVEPLDSEPATGERVMRGAGFTGPDMVDEGAVATPAVADEANMRAGDDDMLAVADDVASELERSSDAPVDGPRGSGAPGLALLAAMFVLTLAPWLVYRFVDFRSLTFELGRYAFLHDLGPFTTDSALRSMLTPQPVLFAVTHPFDFIAKMLRNAIATPVLLVFRLFNPLELVFVVIGTIGLWEDARRRSFVRIILALGGLQLLLSWATMLDVDAWQAVAVLFWIPAAHGIGIIARRLLADWPEVATVGLVMLVTVLPFGAACLDAHLAPDLGNARFTEEEARGLGEWTRLMVPANAPVLTDYHELVWYADRPIVWRPIDPSETETLRATTRTAYTLWQERQGRLGVEEEWRRYFDGEVDAGRLERVGELRLTSGTYVLARWQ